MWLALFKQTIGRKFAPRIELRDEDMNIFNMITTYNIAVTDAASEILWKECHKKSRGSSKMFSTSLMRGDF